MKTSERFSWKFCSISLDKEGKSLGNGLNNTYILNDINKYQCNIVFPKSCPYKIFTYFLDLTKFKKIKCQNRNNNEKIKFLKYSKGSRFVSKNTTHFGFPITNKASECLKKSNIDIDNFVSYVKNNLIDMDNKNIINKISKENIPEVEVDFFKNYGQMKINLNYNKKLSENRKKLEKNSIPYSENIIVLYFDSVSRANSIRKLKKTLKFFEQFMSVKGVNNSKYHSENYHSFQFFKYYSHAGQTTGNYPRIYYKTFQKKLFRITYYLKRIGYITGYGNDYCFRDNINTQHDMKISETYDHQMVICDPNKVHSTSQKIKCLYGKIDLEYLYDYGNQFWRKYINNRKFLNIISNSAHEGSLEVLKYYDDIIYNFLNELYNNNLLKNTSILLLSDHGCIIPSVYYLFEFYRIERRLPMLYIIANDRINMTYTQQYKYIYENQQNIITAYDIFNTINHLAFGDHYYLIKNNEKYNSPKSIFGISLFSKINPKRNLKHYKGLNLNYFCK